MPSVRWKTHPFQAGSRLELPDEWREFRTVVERLKPQQGDELGWNADRTAPVIENAGTRRLIVYVGMNAGRTDVVPVYPAPQTGGLPYRLALRPGGATVRPGTFWLASIPTDQPAARRELEITLERRFDQPSLIQREIEMVRSFYRVPAETPLATPDERDAYSRKYREGLADLQRLDLREHLIYTIDGPDTKDIDDAIEVDEIASGRFRLGVHIADVTHFVLPGSPRDEDAKERGTSHYLADQVTHMLPADLSQDHCSLGRGVDRLAFSVYAEIDTRAAAPAIERVEFHPSVIRSHFRLTYEQVDKILDSLGPKRLLLSDLERSLAAAARLARALRRGFDSGEHSPEPKFRETAGHLERYAEAGAFSHDLIEALMVTANRLVGANLANALAMVPDGKPGLVVFRVQPPPNRNALLEYLETLQRAQIVDEFDFDKVADAYWDIAPSRVGHSVSEKERQEWVRSQLFRDLRALAAESASGQGKEGWLNALEYLSQGGRMVRSATLGARAEGSAHHGLGISRYAWFTSPIRRYPDQVNHRALRAAISGAAVPASTVDVTALAGRLAEAKHAQGGLTRRLNGFLVAQKLSDVSRPLRWIPQLFRFWPSVGLLVQARWLLDGVAEDVTILFNSPAFEAQLFQHGGQCELRQGGTRRRLVLGGKYWLTLALGSVRGAAVHPDLGLIWVNSLADLEKRS